MNLSFHTFTVDNEQLQLASGSVATYPGGDTAVRHLQPAPTGSMPVAWNLGGTLDYAALGQWVAFHRRHDADPVLVMPYLPSARGDHDVTGDAQVAAALTAATGIGTVITADPHAPAWTETAERWGTAVRTVAAAELVASSTLTAPHWEWSGVIAPDHGAVDRAGAVAEVLQVPLLCAGKVRDPANGKLSGFTAPNGIGAGRFLVVDDICDGGGTFAGLAQAIKDTAASTELHLWVTHGLFTGRWQQNLSTNYASITAADTAPESENSPLPHGVRAVRLLPHVLRELARIADPILAA